MIVPLVEESGWLDALRELPPLELNASRVLVVSPHPDDETLGAGALIAALRFRGIEVVIVCVTDGEHAYGESEKGLAAIRQKEQEAALGELRVEPADIHRLRLTDSGLDRERAQIMQGLMPLVTPETHILAPWIHDFHPDHEACGWAAAQVAQRTGAALSWYFFWTWHRGTPAQLEGLNLRSFAFDDTLLATKLKALACHHSQLHRATGDPILPERLLWPARRKFEVFARA